MDVSEVTADLIAEQDALDLVVRDLTAEQWAQPSPSAGWSVADQIGHLAYFDGTAAMAITDEEAFTAARTELMNTFGQPEAEGDNATLGRYRAMSGPELLAAWRANRELLAEAAATLTNETRVEWYGPSMGSKSFLTARLMEAWAHGQHIIDTVGGDRPPTDRLRHIAQLGFITRKWTYVNRGIDMPAEEVQVTLQAPSGASWQWGPEDAPSSVSGPAEDFCLVVTQCRNVNDTALTVLGDAAADWMAKAQAFAGDATDGPGARP